MRVYKSQLLHLIVGGHVYIKRSIFTKQYKNIRTLNIPKLELVHFNIAKYIKIRKSMQNRMRANIKKYQFTQI